MGPGTGNWGMMEAEDETVFRALIAHAEEWLRTKGMQRALGPFSLSVWDEPGLHVSGFGHPPTVMMGQNSPAYRGWVEAAGQDRQSVVVGKRVAVTVDLGSGRIIKKKKKS